MEVLELEAPVAAKRATIAPVSCDFVWVSSDSETGEPGWRPALMPMFNAGSAFHVAHDTLEHLDHSDPSLEAEMRAFGAHLFLRSTTPYWRMKEDLIMREDPLQAFRNMMESRSLTSDDEAASHIFGDLFTFLANDKHKLTAPPLTPRLDRQAEHIMSAAVQLAYMRGGEHLKANFNAAKQDWKERIDSALGWMRIGYRAHAKRFEGLDESTRAYMFLTIEKSVQAMTSGPYRTDSIDDGDKLRVVVSFDTHPEVRVTLDRAHYPTKETVTQFMR